MVYLRDRNDLTQKMLKEILVYDPETGIFTNKVDRGNDYYAGTEAGSFDTHDGYIQIQLHGHRYRAHRLAWLYMTGEWPKGIIDHRNRIRHDNRWVNLKDTTQSENLYNSERSDRVDRGIHLAHGKWCVRIRIGTFTSYKEAYEINLLCQKAIKEVYPEFNADKILCE